MKINSTLIDQKLIDNAQAGVAAAAARLATAQAAIAPAQALADKAREAAEVAIANGDANAVDLSEDADTAARRLNVARRVLAAASEANQRALSDLETQTGVAYRGVYANGVQARLDAARAADKANEALKAAQSKYDEATAAISLAIQAGCDDVVWGQHQTHTLVDEATERHRWSVGYHQNWWQSLDSDGNVAFSG